MLSHLETYLLQNWNSSLNNVILHVTYCALIFLGKCSVTALCFWSYSRYRYIIIWLVLHTLSLSLSLSVAISVEVCCMSKIINIYLVTWILLVANCAVAVCLLDYRMHCWAMSRCTGRNYSVNLTFLTVEQSLIHLFLQVNQVKLWLCGLSAQQTMTKVIRHSLPF